METRHLLCRVFIFLILIWISTGATILFTAPLPPEQRLRPLRISPYVQRVGLDIPSLAGLPDSLTGLPVRKRVDELYARIELAPRTFVEYVTRSDNVAVLYQDAKFKKCANDFVKFKNRINGLAINPKEIEEIAGAMGFDPSVSRGLAAGESEQRKLVQDITFTAGGGWAIQFDPQYKEAFPRTKFVQEKIHLSDLFLQSISNSRGAIPIPRAAEERLLRQAVQDHHAKVTALSSIYTSVICPY